MICISAQRLLNVYQVRESNRKFKKDLYGLNGLFGSNHDLSNLGKNYEKWRNITVIKQKQ